MEIMVIPQGTGEKWLSSEVMNVSEAKMGTNALKSNEDIG
jgi:hypothetical protein